jgi:hypothetical protein
MQIANCLLQIDLHPAVCFRRSASGLHLAACSSKQTTVCIKTNPVHTVNGMLLFPNFHFLHQKNAL